MLKNFPGASGPQAVVQINPYMPAWDNSGWSTVTTDNTSTIFTGYKATASAVPQTNYITFRAVLMQGTWTVDTMYVKSTSAGIFTLALDGTTIGTQDTYAAAIARNQLWTLTGVAVPYSGLHELKFSTPTKNASSSGYAGFLQFVQLTRTN